MLQAFKASFSWRRSLGLTLHLLWMLVLFYTLVPFTLSSDPRDSSYIYMLISMCALALTLGFFFTTLKRGETLEGSNAVIGGAAMLVVVGTGAAIASDSASTVGMLSLGIGSILTGIGSAVLYVGWLSRYVAIDRRAFFLDISLCFIVALSLGAGLAALPAVLGCVVAMLAPPASALLLVKTRGEGIIPPVHAEKQLSGSSYRLFAKALAGAFLFGVLEGFVDGFGGGDATATFEAFGLPLLADGAAVLAMLTLVTAAVRHDSTFIAYRVSVFTMGLGCLFMAFPGIPFLSSGVLVFAGYLCFTVTLVAICADIAMAFRIGMTRSLCLGFAALFAGEICGLAVNMACDGLLMFDGAATLVALVATGVLFFAHLFLFTETDLARIGVGELEEGAAGDGDSPSPQCSPYQGELSGECRAEGVTSSSSDPDVAADTTASATPPHKHSDSIAMVTATCVELYALSPRESEVLPLLLQGRTIARIQETLYISQGTVSTHIRHIYQKCGVLNRQELLDLCENIEKRNV